MNNQVLNITNGEYFNEYFRLKFNNVSVPFCEAIMDGGVTLDIFSQRFVSLRAKSLNVTENEYRAKMYVVEALKRNNYEMICLWFGKDTFCQVNLLTLLAYLEQVEYNGKVILNYIDDENFEVLESDIKVTLGIYKKIYEDILILKRMPSAVGVLCTNAIELYFDYHSDNGMLANLVKANTQMDKTELIDLLIAQSKDYGLSDLQAEKIININLAR